MKWVYITIGVVIICITFWLAKQGSYFLFYEEMVQNTIREMVNPEYLKDSSNLTTGE